MPDSITKEDWGKVLSLHRLFKKINEFVITNYATATPIDLVNLIIDDEYGTICDGMATIYPVEDSETEYSLRTQNYSGATTYHVDGNAMPNGHGGFLKYASSLKEPSYIAHLTDKLSESDTEMLPWLNSMHTALVIPTISIKGEAATTILFAFDEDAFDSATIKHNVMLTYATTNIILNLLLRQETTKAWNALDAELATIGRIQREFLPKELPGLESIECAVNYSTSTRAGGDYYDFFPLSDDRIGIFIADVAGHGSPAAIVMAMTRLLLHTYPNEASPPDDVVTHLNSLLFGNLLPGQFVTAFYVELDTKSMKLTYSNAGHCYPILLRANENKIDLLKTKGGLPLGVVPGGVFDLQETQLQTGDILFFYTDGLVEAMNKDKEMYGAERLNDLLINTAKGDANEIKSAILKDLYNFTTGVAITDDLTFIVMKVN